MSDPRMKIRMYRQGLGDCFLVSIPKQDHSEFHVVIDCGLIQGATPRSGATFDDILADIKQRTAGAPVTLVATHQHWDHMWGFLQAFDAFKTLNVREAWLAWTEDPNDQQAKKLAAGKATAMTALGSSLTAMRAASESALADDVSGYADNLGVAAPIGDAMNKIRELAGGNVRYRDPAADPWQIDGTAVRVYALGPPRDETKLHRMSAGASTGEMYGIAAALTAGLNPPSSDDWMPFTDATTVPLEAAHNDPFFRDQYFTAPDVGWRNIDAAWLESTSQLAIQLDSYTNNTSLVLAFEIDDRDVVLFPGDAQIGSWESWLGLTWKVGGRDITGADLLKRCVVYKVGHHGSHNATMRQGGLETMESLHTAMIPVDAEMAKTKGWTHMPLTAIKDDLKTRTGGRLFMVDDTTAPAAGDVAMTDLYYEVTI